MRPQPACLATYSVALLRSRRGTRRPAAAAVLIVALAALQAPAALAEESALTTENLKKETNGALAVLGFSVVPNETATAINLDAGGGDVRFRAQQLGGAFTWSDDFPLYLEGFIGAARYDPKYVFEDTGSDVGVSAKWDSYSVTGGVGWDFRLADELVLRPIANLSFGHVKSDTDLTASLLVEDDPELLFLQDGELNAIGFGGSLMLDWEHYRENYEVDVELRYTHIRLQTIGGTSNLLEGHSDAIALGLWTRLRVPLGVDVFDSPLRGVAEFSASGFFGDQADALDTPVLGQAGAGIEFDFAKVEWLPVDRARIMGRYLMGKHLYGFALGIGITF